MPENDPTAGAVFASDEFLEQQARNTPAPMSKYDALVAALIAKGVITQQDIDEAAS